MKLSFLTGLAVVLLTTPAVSAQLFSLHLGSDGVGLDVTNASPYFPVIVSPPVHHRERVHIPLRRGFVPEPVHHAAPRHQSYPRYRGTEGWTIAVPASIIVYDGDDWEDYRKESRKEMKKRAKKYRKEQKKRYKEFHKKARQHHKHHHDD